MTRTFLGTAGLLTGGGSPAVDETSRPETPRIEVHGLSAEKPSPLGMPGLFPGRVVDVFDANSIVHYRVSQEVVHRMLEEGMRELTGENSVKAAWRRFIEPTDVVGIKINPSGAPACCSSPELVREIIRSLEMIGVPRRNILVYDRYSYEIDLGSYQALMTPGVRVVGIEDGVFDIKGYDANVFCEACFFGEWETRSYLAKVVSTEIGKIINVPTMKDHSASGVTGCLKNLGYGSFNNVARSHVPPHTFTDPLIGVMCGVEPLRSKAVLNIMDGLRQVWHGGPLTQVRDFITEAKTLYLGTDPVAVDAIELEVIEQKRRQEGAPSLWDDDPKSITTNSEEFYTNPGKNLFFRQPGHVAAAGKLGLGIADLAQIDHRKIRLG